MRLLLLLLIVGNFSFLAAQTKPRNVGSAKQLFIDNLFIESSKGTELVINRPRITREKLIIVDRPWETYWIGGYSYRSPFCSPSTTLIGVASLHCKTTCDPESTQNSLDNYSQRHKICASFQKTKLLFEAQSLIIPHGEETRRLDRAP